MWKCPKCGRPFIRTHQGYYCGKAPQTVLEYIDSQPAETRVHLTEMMIISAAVCGGDAAAEYHGGRAAGALHVRVRVLAGHGGPVHWPDRANDPRSHAAGGDGGHAAGPAGNLPRVHGAGIGGVFDAAEKARFPQRQPVNPTTKPGLSLGCHAAKDRVFCLLPQRSAQKRPAVSGVFVRQLNRQKA